MVIATSFGCDAYDSPPRASLPDVDELGVLPDAAAPLRLAFDEPIDGGSLKVRVIRYQVDGEGRLYDEDDDPTTQLEQLYEDVGPELVGGIGDLDGTKTVYTMSLTHTLPMGPQLAVLIEPGLADEEGNAWQVRQLFKFGINFGCGDDPRPTNFPDAKHFMKVEVDSPIDTQLQLFADIRTDPDTGLFVGQFTNADRDAAIDCGVYGLSCDPESEVCRTLPGPECVEPSKRVATTDEYPDYIHNVQPPTGYSFTVRGCVENKAEQLWAFTNAPVDIQVESPPVGVKGIKFNAQFEYDDLGVLRGEGAFSAQELFLGDTPNGAALGSVFMR
ncbi:MAG: hypothetical protein JRI68_35485, partial [Deltaproteobacteria bacterium]|nr:hypothetical protein [Deltaproteobacteria bacterium]